jgi:hypothetical protein
MHKRWRDYAVTHLAAASQGSPAKLQLALDGLHLNFSYVIITRCTRCPELVDTPAIVMIESRDAFRLITATSRHVTVPKPGTWLAVPLPHTAPAAATAAAMAKSKGGSAVASSERTAAVLELDCGRLCGRGGNARWLNR